MRIVLPLKLGGCGSSASLLIVGIPVVVRVAVVIGPAACQRERNRSQANSGARGGPDRVIIAPAVVTVPVMVPAMVPIMMPVVIVDLFDRY
jgi:hypothetical protein